MSVQTRWITADELERMRFSDKRVELIKGEIVEIPPAGHEHGGVGMSLAWRLATLVEQNNLGRVYLAETGFILTRNPDTVRAPDISFVSAARAAQQKGQEGFFDGAPDLAVEIVSPGDSDIEVQEKVMDYVSAGTKVIWIVRPRLRTITTYRSDTQARLLTLRETLEGEDILPGFAVPLKDIFET